MENKIEFILKPVSGAASAGGGFRAILNTAKGDALDFDDVITEALDRGYKDIKPFRRSIKIKIIPAS